MDDDKEAPRRPSPAVIMAIAAGLRARRAERARTRPSPGQQDGGSEVGVEDAPATAAHDDEGGLSLEAPASEPPGTTAPSDGHADGSADYSSSEQIDDEAVEPDDMREDERDEDLEEERSPGFLAWLFGEREPVGSAPDGDIDDGGVDDRFGPADEDDRYYVAPDERYDERYDDDRYDERYDDDRYDERYDDDDLRAGDDEPSVIDRGAEADGRRPGLVARLLGLREPVSPPSARARDDDDVSDVEDLYETDAADERYAAKADHENDARAGADAYGDADDNAFGDDPDDGAYADEVTEAPIAHEGDPLHDEGWVLDNDEGVRDDDRRPGLLARLFGASEPVGSERDDEFDEDAIERSDGPVAEHASAAEDDSRIDVRDEDLTASDVEDVQEPDLIDQHDDPSGDDDARSPLVPPGSSSFEPLAVGDRFDSSSGDGDEARIRAADHDGEDGVWVAEDVRYDDRRPGLLARLFGAREPVAAAPDDVVHAGEFEDLDRPAAEHDDADLYDVDGAAAGGEGPKGTGGNTAEDDSRNDVGDDELAATDLEDVARSEPIDERDKRSDDDAAASHLVPPGSSRFVPIPLGESYDPSSGEADESRAAAADGEDQEGVWVDDGAASDPDIEGVEDVQEPEPIDERDDPSYADDADDADDDDDTASHLLPPGSSRFVPVPVDDNDSDNGAGDSSGRTRSRRPIAARDVVLVASLLIVILVTAVLVRSALRDQTASQTTASRGAGTAVPTPPPAAPEVGSYIESRVSANGDIAVRQWVRSREPLFAVRLEMPAVNGVNGLPGATDVVIASDQALLNQPGTVTSDGQRLFFDSPPRAVYLSYTLKGAVVTSSSVAGRALAPATAMHLDYSPRSGPSRVTLISEKVLSMACSDSPVGALDPCGKPANRGWSVLLRGDARNDTVVAQVDLLG